MGVYLLVLGRVLGASIVCQSPFVDNGANEAPYRLQV
jgi:hypothetical protein